MANLAIVEKCTITRKTSYAKVLRTAAQIDDVRAMLEALGAVDKRQARLIHTNPTLRPQLPGRDTREGRRRR